MGHYICPQPGAVTAPPWHLQWLDLLRVAVEKGGNQAASVCQLVGLVTGFLTFPVSKIHCFLGKTGENINVCVHGLTMLQQGIGYRAPRDQPAL